MANISIGRMVLGTVQTNCYFVYDKDTMEAVVIDPPKKGIYETLNENGISVKAILLTHGHFDHIMGVHELTKMSGAKVYALKEEDELLKDSRLNSSEMIRRPYTVDADILVSDGDVLNLIGIDFKVIATPGHTAGSCCYYIDSQKWLISGDTLFAGSIGRTDLPTGNEAAIMKSVRMLVDTLDGDVKVYPGHGESSTIEVERKYNPFCS